MPRCDVVHTTLSSRFNTSSRVMQTVCMAHLRLRDKESYLAQEKVQGPMCREDKLRQQRRIPTKDHLVQRSTPLHVAEACVSAKYFQGLPAMVADAEAARRWRGGRPCCDVARQRRLTALRMLSLWIWSGLRARWKVVNDFDMSSCSLT